MFDYYKITWKHGTKSIIIIAYNEYDAYQYMFDTFGEKGFIIKYATQNDLKIFNEITGNKIIIKTEKVKLGFT